MAEDQTPEGIIMKFYVRITQIFGYFHETSPGNKDILRRILVIHITLGAIY